MLYFHRINLILSTLSDELHKIHHCVVVVNL